MVTPVFTPWGFRIFSWMGEEKQPHTPGTFQEKTWEVQNPHWNFFNSIKVVVRWYWRARLTPALCTIRKIMCWNLPRDLDIFCGFQCPLLFKAETLAVPYSVAQAGSEWQSFSPWTHTNRATSLRHRQEMSGASRLRWGISALPLQMRHSQQSTTEPVYLRTQ